MFAIHRDAYHCTLLKQSPANAAIRKSSHTSINLVWRTLITIYFVLPLPSSLLSLLSVSVAVSRVARGQQKSIVTKEKNVSLNARVGVLCSWFFFHRNYSVIPRLIVRQYESKEGFVP